MVPSNFRRKATRLLNPSNGSVPSSQAGHVRHMQLHPRTRLIQTAAPNLSAEEPVGRQSSTMLPVGKPPRSVTHLNQDTLAIFKQIPEFNATPTNSFEDLSEPEKQRRMLKERRFWESTTLGHLVGEAGPNSAVGNGTRFKVLNYNILAQVHLETHKYLYKDCQPLALDWNYRLNLFFKEVLELKPEVICLQEVEKIEFYHSFEAKLAHKGYKGVFKKRTRDKPDGCAIFWKHDTFSLLGKLAIDFYQPHVPLLDRDNVGLLVKLQSRIGRRPKLVIGTTHLLYNPRRNDIRLAQVQLLLAELERFSCSGYSPNGEPQYYPTIICGDFNTEPYSSIIRLVTDGQLQYVDAEGQRPKLLLKRGMNDFLPTYVGISDQCQHYRVILERYLEWKKHRRNEFLLDIKTQLPLVNLHSTERHGEFWGANPLIKQSSICVDLDPTQSSGSGLSRLAANFGEEADADTMSISNNSYNGGQSMEILPHLSVEVDPKHHAKILDDISKTGTVCTFGSGELSHKLRMRSVYAPKLDRRENNENVATTKQTSWTCADYIFYGMQWNEHEGRRVEGNLKLLRRLGLLTRTQCKELGSLPSLATPSDHYPLIAEFLLK